VQCASLVQVQGIEHDSCMHASQLHGVLSRSIMQVAVSSTSGPISPPPPWFPSEQNGVQGCFGDMLARQQWTSKTSKPVGLLGADESWSPQHGFNPAIEYQLHVRPLVTHKEKYCRPATAALIATPQVCSRGQLGVWL
jgi:hypothetical protein